MAFTLSFTALLKTQILASVSFSNITVLSKVKIIFLPQKSYKGVKCLSYKNRKQQEKHFIYIDPPSLPDAPNWFWDCSFSCWLRNIGNCSLNSFGECLIRENWLRADHQQPNQASASQIKRQWKGPCCSYKSLIINDLDIP